MCKIKSQRIDIFNKVYPFIKCEYKLYIVLGGLQVWFLILSLITPLLYLIFINNIIIDKNLKLLAFVILGYIGIFLLQTLGIVVNKKLYNKLFFKLSIKIKTQLLKTYTKMDINAFEKYEIGDLKKRMDNDVSIIENFLNTHILGYLFDISNATVIIIILFVMSPILAAISIVMVPVSFWFANIIGRKVKIVSEIQRDLQGKYSSFLYDTFQNWKEVKSNSLEEKHNEIFQDYRIKLSESFIKSQIYVYLNKTFIDFKDFFITKMNLYFIGGLLIISGHMNVGILLAFMNYYSQFFESIAKITDSKLGLKNDIPSIKRVMEVFDIIISEKPKVKLSHGITLSNLCFKYNDSQRLILNNVSLRIYPKEHIGIVGRSGCGKTTLINLIIGMYEPKSGNITIGDNNINDISFESVVNKIGIVLQNPWMFNLTVKENLQFSKKQASDEELIQACKKANIYSFIENLPDKFNTIIGENGIKLSGGQKQRLSIARTLLQDSDIIIFDESTNSLDSESEMEIIRAIKELSKNKTVITISHRLSTILMCDRVIVMDLGEIVAIDTNENLRGKNEIYDLLFEKQYSL